MGKNVRHGRCYSIPGLSLRICLINGTVRVDGIPMFETERVVFPRRLLNSGLARRLPEPVRQIVFSMADKARWIRVTN